MSGKNTSINTNPAGLIASQITQQNSSNSLHTNDSDETGDNFNDSYNSSIPPRVIEYRQNQDGGHSLIGLKEGDVVRVIASSTVNDNLAIGDIDHILEVENCHIKDANGYVDDFIEILNAQPSATQPASSAKITPKGVRNLASTIYNAIPTKKMTQGLRDTASNVYNAMPTQKMTQGFRDAASSMYNNMKPGKMAQGLRDTASNVYNRFTKKRMGGGSGKRRYSKRNIMTRRYRKHNRNLISKSK